VNRIDIINTLIQKYNFRTYLEIGVQLGYSFEGINCEYKVGVDPEKHYDKLTHQMTSDQFFEQNTQKFDIVFIDGLHLHEQVQIDFEHALQCLNPNGIIVLHDCNPTEELWQRRVISHQYWTGDTWKAWARIIKSYPSNLTFTVDDDFGVGVFFNNNTILVPIIDQDFSWEQLELDRKTMMHLISPKEFSNLLL
jgi:hypothetical protein